MSNVIDFPEAKTVDPLTILKQVEDNIQNAMDRLDKKADNFKERDNLADGPTENAIRDLEGAVRSLHLYAEAQAQLVQMIKHDLVNSLKNMEEYVVAQFTAAGHLQVVISLLKEKGVVTDEEMRAMWEKVITPQVQDI